MNLKQAMHSITTRIHTDHEIEEIALKRLENHKGTHVIFSNSEDIDKRRVSIFLPNGLRVYSCDLTKTMAEEGNMYLSALIDSFCKGERLYYITLD